MSRAHGRQGRDASHDADAGYDEDWDDDVYYAVDYRLGKPRESKDLLFTLPAVPWETIQNPKALGRHEYLLSHPSSA